jgi:hypothetical protein
MTQQYKYCGLRNEHGYEMFLWLPIHKAVLASEITLKAKHSDMQHKWFIWGVCQSVATGEIFDDQEKN